jgi:hypothetical protein
MLDYFLPLAEDFRLFTDIFVKNHSGSFFPANQLQSMNRKHAKEHSERVFKTASQRELVCCTFWDLFGLIVGYRKDLPNLGRFFFLPKNKSSCVRQSLGCKNAVF